MPVPREFTAITALEVYLGVQLISFTPVTRNHAPAAARSTSQKLRARFLRIPYMLISSKLISSLLFIFLTP